MYLLSRPSQLTRTDIKQFRSHLYRYYARHARDLPWRTKTIKPYHVFVSEVMLQQTQVDRVVDKYTHFIKRFKNFKQLAKAPLSMVLKEWQGLGYNRRALFLHRSAQKIISDFGGRLPRDPECIETLPGIGKATAASICAFAYNMPVVFVETNIRSVFIHHFLNGQEGVDDQGIICLVRQALDVKNPAKWYSALMDYGTMLKKEHGNPSRKSKHYTTQSRFEGSHRQVRGEVLRFINNRERATLVDISKGVKKDIARVTAAVNDLMREGFIKKEKRYFCISGV